MEEETGPNKLISCLASTSTAGLMPRVGDNRPCSRMSKQILQPQLKDASPSMQLEGKQTVKS